MSSTNAPQRMDQAGASRLPGDRFDAVVIGAGFAGLYMLHKLRGMGFSVRGFEGAPDVGGTWYWNRYPGCRCDVESMQYSYQFSDDLQREWDWSERFAAQSDILDYIEHVADRFDLRRDFQFNTRVNAAAYDDATAEWVVETDADQIVRARFLILGVGCLSTTNTPNFEGAADFRGEVYHTGNWPHEEVDFAGKRVGIIGTGSSAVQIIPIVAKEAGHLYVFQRTANYVVPARNRPLARDEMASVKARYAQLRASAKTFANAFAFPRFDESAHELTPEERHQRLENQWEIGGLAFMGAFGDTLTNEFTNEVIVDFWRQKVRETVKDAATAEMLLPDDAFGCKRVCSGTDYYEAYNRDNVTLVDVSKTGVERFTENGLCGAGEEHALDIIICATGFDAMTGSVLRIAITGQDGLTMQEKWKDGPETYLGLSVAGFPNLFNINGPGSPSVLASMVAGAEQHVDFIADCLAWMRENGKTRIAATSAAEQDWSRVIDTEADATLRTGCNSWHLGTNIPGKPRRFMPYIGGFPKYVARCEEVAQNDYLGFDVT